MHEEIVDDIDPVRKEQQDNENSAGDVDELGIRIQSSMTSLMNSLRLVDAECSLAREAVQQQQSSMERKLRESACALNQSIDSHVRQDKLTLTQHLGILTNLIERFETVKQTATDPYKQREADALRIDLTSWEQSQHSRTPIEFQPSDISKQFLQQEVVLGNINIRSDKELDYVSGRLLHNDLDLTCDKTREKCACHVTNMADSACVNTVDPETVLCENFPACRGSQSNTTLQEPPRAKRKIVGSHGYQVNVPSNHPSISLPSLNVAKVNDLHCSSMSMSSSSTSNTHVTEHCNTVREGVEGTESNTSSSSMISLGSSLFELDSSPITCTDFASGNVQKLQKLRKTNASAMQEQNDGLDRKGRNFSFQEAEVASLSNETIINDTERKGLIALKYNISGCGFMYNDTWLPNIVQGRTRSVDEMSFAWSSESLCISSDASSLSDNCAYTDVIQTGESFTQRKEAKISNLDCNTESVEAQTTGSARSLEDRSLNRVSRRKSDSRREVLSCRFSTAFETQKHRTACVIPDIAWLHDNRIILADHYHNNIQLFDESFNFVAEQPCPYPMGICSVDKVKDVAAVTLRRDGRVAIFKAEKDRITMIRTIVVKCEYYIWNVVYKAGNVFVMCDENNIHVMDLNGKQLDVVNSGISTESGYIRYFDVSDDGLVLYLCTDMGLVCVQRTGQHLWTFTMDQIPDKSFNSIPRDVTSVCDKLKLRPFGSKLAKYGQSVESVLFYGDRLLATHWMQSSVIELGLDGRYVQHLVTEGLEHPRSMTTRRGKLAITQFNPTMKEKQKRTVNIYDLVFK